MRVLLVRCANGFAVWRLAPNRRTNITSALCLNDGFQVSSGLVMNADVVDFLQAIAAHSVALKGAFQSVTQLDLPQ